jgi:hypothetical protein
MTPAVSAMLARLVADLLARGVDLEGDRECVYLLHFALPYRHARHYLGSTMRLGARLVAHLSGRGSPLVAAVVAAGIDVTVARTWDGGRGAERLLKRRKNNRRLCPVCRGASVTVDGQADHGAHRVIANE